MSEWPERKKRFYRDIARHGISGLEDLKKLYPLGWDMKDETLQKWLDKFHRIPTKIPYSRVPRFVNHFKQGADPEFICYNPEIGERVNAQHLNLRAGRAFGADNNGRLVEIRPYADKSQIKVLASILAAMRWMAIKVPETRNLQWRCGAYLQEDGLGGHVHIGRRRNLDWGQHRVTPNPEPEIRALDAFNSICVKLGMYPKEELARRQAGDAHGQRYGLPGDVRIQAHGYEYRTLPSWLDSPWLAYFTLVMTKLVVHDPEIAIPRIDDPVKHIFGILKYFRGLDDDARLVLRMLGVAGFPVHIGGDFRARWGLRDYPSTIKTEVSYIPESIKPSEEDISEIFMNFVHNVPLKRGYVPTPTWSPVAPPKGYVAVLDYLDTRGAKGFGEILKDIVIPVELKQTLPITLHRNHGNETLMLPILDEYNYLAEDWAQRVSPKASIKFNSDIVRGGISISETARYPDNWGSTRKLLTCGIFPIWKITEVKPESYKDWLANNKFYKIKVNKLYGKCVESILGADI